MKYEAPAYQHLRTLLKDIDINKPIELLFQEFFVPAGGKTLDLQKNCNDPVLLGVSPQPFDDHDCVLGLDSSMGSSKVEA